MADKTVLCFGDSITFGLHPMNHMDDFRRMDKFQRWPGVVRSELGAGVEVIEAGLSARTTVHDDPIEGRYRNGIAVLPALLESHMPLDIVIVMLGTNDFKKRFSLSAIDVAHSVQEIVELIQNTQTGPDFEAPEVLLVAPPHIYERNFFAEIMEGAEIKSQKLPQYIQRVSEHCGVPFLNASEIVAPEETDGVHLSVESQKILGVQIADMLKDLLDWKLN